METIMESKVTDKPKAKKVKAEAKAPATPKAPETVWFQSKEIEPTQFSIRDNYASLEPGGRLVWEFSQEDAVFVRRHHFVQTGRVLEVD
jgi:hypothetical protein